MKTIIIFSLFILLTSALHAQQKNQSLKNHILENFTWEKTAQQTLAAYQTVLGDT